MPFPYLPENNRTYRREYETGAFSAERQNSTCPLKLGTSAGPRSRL